MNQPQQQVSQPTYQPPNSYMAPPMPMVAPPVMTTEAFSQDEANPFRLKVTNPRAIYGKDLTKLQMRQLNKLQATDDYLWKRSTEGGLTTGFKQLDSAVDNDLSPGLYLFAAAPNVGKSMIMLQIADQIVKLNENVHVAYHALDDTTKDILPRFIATHEAITISQAKSPSRYQDNPEALDKRNDAMKYMYNNMHKLSFWDADEGRNVKELEQHIKDLRMELGEDTRIVLMFDSIYDIEAIFAQNEKQAHEEVAKTVKSWCGLYDVVIMATAHLKKTGGRRPMSEDLKENNRLEFEANFIALLYNEVGLKEEEANIYWLHEDREEKLPVIEMRIAKNKFGSYKGTLFFEFFPDLSTAYEVEKENAKRYIANMGA